MAKNWCIKINCGRETFFDFKRFVADREFKDYESALKFLLDEAQRLNLHPGRYV